MMMKREDPSLEGNGTLDRAQAVFEIFQSASRLSTIEMPKKALVLSTHANSPVGMGDYIVRNILGGTRDRVLVAGTPHDIVVDVRDLARGGKQFGCVVASFELHHAASADAKEILGWVREMVGRQGLLFLADYVLEGVEPEEARRATSSTDERRQIEGYGGFDKWLRAHACYSARRLRAIVEDAGFGQIKDIPLPANRHAVVASDTINVQSALEGK